MLGKSKSFSRAGVIWSTRAFLWQTPLLHAAYLIYLAARYRGPNSTLVTSSCDVCIEAFPRSANTFLVQALRLSTGRSLKIAHHLHSPLQIKRSVGLGVPMVVILRNPLDCFTSFKLKTPRLNVEVMHRVFIRFHEYAMGHSGRINFVRYEDVVADPRAVIAQIHRWMGIEYESVAAFDKEAVFNAIDAAKEQREGIKAAADQRRFATSLARPTVEKEAAKHAVRAEIQKQHPDLVASAESLYRKLLAFCPTI